MKRFEDKDVVYIDIEGRPWKRVENDHGTHRHFEPIVWSELELEEVKRSHRLGPWGYYGDTPYLLTGPGGAFYLPKGRPTKRMVECEHTEKREHERKSVNGYST